MSATHLVFVYGTLKRGYPNADFGMPRATFLGEYRTRECYPLVIGGKWNSPYLINEPGSGYRVTGEVYKVDELLLAELDEFESVHLERGYRRIAIGVEPMASDGHVVGKAWAYLRERRHIEGIHAGPMETYPLEAGYISLAYR